LTSSPNDALGIAVARRGVDQRGTAFHHHPQHLQQAVHLWVIEAHVMRNGGTETDHGQRFTGGRNGSPQHALRGEAQRRQKRAEGSERGDQGGTLQQLTAREHEQILQIWQADLHDPAHEYGRAMQAREPAGVPELFSMFQSRWVATPNPDTRDE